MKFEGVMTAIVSPFKNDEIDSESFLKIAKFQYDKGIRSLVINGTTGESPTLRTEEIKHLVDLIKKSSMDFNIIVGAGGNNTSAVCEAAKYAQEIGADAILSVVPYYNKPTQEGIYQHFKKIAASVEIPVVLYNVPGRTITSIDVPTVKRLFEIENIKAIKEAAGKVEVIEQLIKEVPGIKVLSGDDGTYIEAATKACHGVISVISHLIPEKFVEWTHRAHEGDLSVIEEYKQYDDLCNLLFAEPNPVPVKTSLKIMGLISSDEVRLPLVKCTDELAKKLRVELSERGI